MERANSVKKGKNQPRQPFVGSQEILQAVFDAINFQVFNCNLDGIILEWCDELKSRTIVTYKKSTFATKQTNMRCSKFWFKNRTRKEFVESLLYEMIHVYMQVNNNICEKKEDPNLDVYLLEGAISYFNVKFETNLSLNNNYKTSDDEADVQKILSSLIGTNNDDHSKVPPKVKLLTKKLSGNKEAVKCGTKCGGFCYCNSAAALRHRFINANIFFIFTLGKTKCFLCEDEIPKGSLANHFDKDCCAFKSFVFNESTSSAN